MSTLMTKRLSEIKKKVKEKNPLYPQICEICDTWIDQKLIKIFSFDLGRGTPRLKPKIVRGAKDYWTRDEKVDKAYKSELSNYLGHFIHAHTEKKDYPSLSKNSNSLLYQNGKSIENWLKNVVAKAHEIDSEDDFVSGIKIIKYLSQDLIWDFERPDLIKIIETEDFSTKKTDAYILCELVQTLSVCHYLLDRCCFTIIQPTDDDWAFDMFQSLNATGTPLPAIETFKPTIVNTVDNESEKQFKDSRSEEYFKKVEELLQETTSAQQKSKRTNDFLTSFFVSLDGRTISTHFSYQRKALDTSYTVLTSFEEKELFVKSMGNYAEFYQNWLVYDGKNSIFFPKISLSHDADIASMLILFLKSSNHKMAITALGSIYNHVINEEVYAQVNFTDTVKLIAAYYFLWRSAFPNAGLDATYRDYFKKLHTNNEKSTVNSLKDHFKSVLVDKDIHTKDKWKHKSKNYLKYKSAGNEVIKLSLLATAHDTIADDSNKGILKIGRANSSKYLCLSKWLCPDLKTIEHIAPQTNDGSWDEELYDPTELYQSVGNLTLLPSTINSSAGNRPWNEKLLYYKCLAEKDPTNIEQIDSIAQALGISLNQSTIGILQGSNFNQHVESITILSESDIWSKDLVEKRNDKVLDIVWERISPWIM